MSPEYIHHIRRDETAERADEHEFQIEHKAPPRHRIPSEWMDIEYQRLLTEAMEDEDQQDDYEQKVREDND